MEPCGILDGDESHLIDRLVEKRVEKMQKTKFCIVNNAVKDEIREDIKDELFMRTGKKII